MDRSRVLYDELNSNKLYTKSYDEFVKQFGTPDGQKRLYNELSSNKLYTKSQEDFSNQFWSNTTTPEIKKKDVTDLSGATDFSDSSFSILDNIQDFFSSKTPVKFQTGMSTFDTSKYLKENNLPEPMYGITEEERQKRKRLDDYYNSEAFLPSWANPLAHDGYGANMLAKTLGAGGLVVAAGMDGIGVMMSKAVEGTKALAAQSAIAAVTGSLEPFTMDTHKDFTEAQNKLQGGSRVEFFGKLGQATNDIAGVLSRNVKRDMGFAEDEMDKGITDLASEGKVGKSIGLTVFEVFKNAPQMALLASTGGSAAGVFAGATALGTGTAATEAYSQDKDFSYADAGTSLAKGLVEGITESIFRTDINAARSLGKSLIDLQPSVALQSIKNLIKEEGADAAKNVIIRDAKTVMKKMLGGAFEEGSEEILATIGDFVIDRARDGKWNEADYNRLLKQTIDSFIIGAASGGLMSGAAAYATYTPLEKEQQKKVEKFMEIADNPELSQEVRDMAQKQADDIVKYNADKHYTHYTQIAGLPIEQRLEAVKILNDIKQLNNDKQEVKDEDTIANINKSIEEKTAKVEAIIDNQAKDMADNIISSPNAIDGNVAFSPESNLTVSPNRGYVFHFPSQQDIPEALRQVTPVSKGMVEGRDTSVYRVSYTGKDLIKAGLAAEAAPVSEAQKADMTANVDNTTEAVDNILANSPEVLAPVASQFEEGKDGKSIGQQIAEAYHEAKQNNANPELISQVNEAISNSLTAPTLTTQPVVTRKATKVPKSNVLKGLKVSQAAEITENIENDFSGLLGKLGKGTKRVLQNYVKALKSISPDAKLFYYEDAESMKQGLLNSGFTPKQAEEKSKAGGLFTTLKKNGQIIIHVNRKSDLITEGEKKGFQSNIIAAHEIVHAALLDLSRTNPTEFIRMKNDLLTMLAKDETANKDVMDFVARYSDRTEVIQAEEFLAQLGALITRQQAELKRSTLDKIKLAIRAFLQNIATKFRSKSLMNLVNSTVFSDTARIEDTARFLEGLGKAIREGSQVDMRYIKNLVKGSEAYQNGLRQSLLANMESVPPNINIETLMDNDMGVEPSDIKESASEENWLDNPENKKRMNKYIANIQGMTENDIWLAKAIALNEAQGEILYTLKNKEAVEAKLEEKIMEVMSDVVEAKTGTDFMSQSYLFEADSKYLFTGWTLEKIENKIKTFLNNWNANEYLRWNLIKNDNAYHKEEVSVIREIQSTALLDNIEGFYNLDAYDWGFKYLLLNSSIYNRYKILDQDTKALQLYKYKQSQLSSTEASYPTLEFEVVKRLYNNKEASNSSMEIGYAYQMEYINMPKTSIKNSSLAKYILKDSSTKEGTWLKFPQGDDPAIAQDLFKIARTSHKYLAKWCTGASVSHATAQLRGGDFYIFVDNKTGDARIAAKYSGNSVGEVRGLGSGQMILPEDSAIIEEFVNTFPDGAAYDSYRKTLNDIIDISENSFSEGQKFMTKTEKDYRFDSDSIKEIIKYVAPKYNVLDLIRIMQERDRSYNNSDYLLQNIQHFIKANFQDILEAQGRDRNEIYTGYLPITVEQAKKVKFITVETIDRFSEAGATYNFENLEFFDGRMVVRDDISVIANKLIGVQQIILERGNFTSISLKNAGIVTVNRDSVLFANNLETIDRLNGHGNLYMSLPKLKTVKKTLTLLANDEADVSFPSLETADTIDIASSTNFNNQNYSLSYNFPKLRTTASFRVDTDYGTKVTVRANLLENIISDMLIIKGNSSSLNLVFPANLKTSNLEIKNNSTIPIIIHNSIFPENLFLKGGRIELNLSGDINSIEVDGNARLKNISGNKININTLTVEGDGRFKLNNVQRINNISISVGNYDLDDPFTTIESELIKNIKIINGKAEFLVTNPIETIFVGSGAAINTNAKNINELELFNGAIVNALELTNIENLTSFYAEKINVPKLKSIRFLRTTFSSENKYPIEAPLLSSLKFASFENAYDSYTSLSLPNVSDLESIGLYGKIKLFVPESTNTENVTVQGGAFLNMPKLKRGYSYSQLDRDSSVSDSEGNNSNYLPIQDIKESVFGDIGQPSRVENEKRQKKSYRDKIADIYRATFERNEEARKALNKEDMDFSLYTMYLKAGATPWAMRKFANYFINIYKGLDEKQKKNLDSIIFLERVIAIDTNFDNRAVKRPAHPAIPQDNGLPIVTNKESAQAELDKYKAAFGDAKYNDLQSRKDLYFKAFSDLLLYKQENGLISKATYELYKDYNYSPRKFLKEIIDGNGISPKTYAVRGVNLGSDEIKNIDEGSVDYMLFDSEKLLKSALISAENKVMTNRALKFLFKEGVIRKSDIVKDANYDTYKNGQIKLNEDGTPKVKEASSGFINKKYKDNDGKVYTFQLRSDISEQFDDAKQESLRGWQAKVLSYMSGSPILRNAAVNVNLFFGLINPIIDLGTQVMFSNTYKKSGSGLIRQSIAAASTFVGITKELMAIDAREYLARKGVASKPLENNTELRQLIEEYGKYGGFMTTQNQENTESNLKFFRRFGEFLGYYGNITEISSKLAAFKFIKETKLKEFADTHKDPTTGDSIEPTEEEMQNILIDAAYHARATLDYNRGGDWAKRQSQFSAFLNVNLQVKKIGVQYIVTNPADFIKKMTDGIYVTAAITLANLLISSDDYEKDKRIKKEKNTKTVIMLPFTLKELGLSSTDERAYIPIPTPSLAKALFNVGQVMAENLYYKSTGKLNPSEGSSAAKLLEDNYVMFRNELVGIILPPTLKSFVQNYFNYDFYTGDVISKDEARGVIGSMQGMGNENVLGAYKWVAQSIDKLTDKDGIGYGGGLQISPEKFQKATEVVITSPAYNSLVNEAYWLIDNMFNVAHKAITGQEVSADMKSKYMKQSIPESIGDFFGKGFGRLIKFTDPSKYDEPDFDSQKETREQITLMDARLETRRAELYDDLKDIYVDAKEKKLPAEKLKEKFEAYKSEIKDPKDYNYIMAIGQMFIDKGKVQLPLNADKYYNITGVAKDPRAKAYAIWKSFGDIRANEGVINDLTALGVDQSVGHEYEGILIANGLVDMDDSSKPIYSDWYKSMISGQPTAKSGVKKSNGSAMGFNPPLNIVANTPINSISAFVVGAALNVSSKVAGEIANIYNNTEGKFKEAGETIDSKLDYIKNNLMSNPIVQDVKNVVNNPDLVLAAYQRWKDKNDESGTTQSKIVLPKKLEPSALKEFSLTGGKTAVGSDTTNLGNLRLSNSDYYTSSAIIDLNKADVGYRNRGDYKEGQTNLQAQFLFPFETPKDLPANKMYVGIKNGKMITGNGAEMKGADVVSYTPFAQVAEITNEYANIQNYKYPIFKKLGGDEQEARLNISLSKDGKDNVNNRFAGGATLLETPDKKQKYIVRGSLEQVKSAFNELKSNTNSKYLNVYILDNGSYSTGLTTPDSKSSTEELKAYEAKNVAGSHSIFLK